MQKVIFASHGLDKHETELLPLVETYFHLFEEKGLMKNRQLVFVDDKKVNIKISNEDIIIFFVTLENVKNEDYMSLLISHFENKYFVMSFSLEYFRSLIKGLRSSKLLIKEMKNENIIPNFSKEVFEMILS